MAALEADRIGHRLIDGPPEAPPRVGISVEEAAPRRFRALLAPDDQDHPARLLNRLEATAASCRWLVDRWTELALDLEDDGPGWTPDRRRMAVRLLGKQPVDALDDPEVRRIYLGAFVLGGRDQYVFNGQADGMTRDAFRVFLARLRARQAGSAVPQDRASALRCLHEVISGALERLKDQADMHAARAGRAEELALYDGEAGDRSHQFRQRTLMAMLRTLELLRNLQRHPEPAPMTAILTLCAGIRNEPNDPDGGR